MSEEPGVRHPKAVNCGSCRALIVWFKTPQGRKMPVDEETVRPTDGENDLDLSRHRSHFATCPDANKHRKPRR